MKTSLLAAAIVASLSAPIAWADDMPMSGKPAMNMGADKQAAATQANMDKMHQQMDKIRVTTDPKERQKLMQAHMQTMQENMKTMGGMASKAKGTGEHAGMAMGDKNAPMQNSDAQKRQDMTDKRMDMMQDMMEQMMERDKASKPMGDM